MRSNQFLFALAFLTSLLGLDTRLNAQETNATLVSLGSTTHSGSGCPTALSPVLSPDGSALSLLFDAFTVEADVSNPVARKTCDISISVNVPAGLSVNLVGADYRGFNDLPLGASSSLSVEYFFAGGKTNPTTASFNGPLSTNYILQHNVNPANQPFSSCTGAKVLRINTSLRVSSNAAGEQAFSTVDSADVIVNDPNPRTGVVVFLSYQSCVPNSASSLAISTTLLGLLGSVALLLL